MSELFGEVVSRTCASDRDRDIFQLAYGASLLLFKLGDECELWDDDLFKRVVEKLEKIKRMTSETYDEIARALQTRHGRSRRETTMIDKKCKMCGDPAEWEWNSEFYCECCLGIELCIYIIDPPLRCKQCGTPLEGSYFTDDDDDNVFCSRACALEYNDAKKLDEEKRAHED